MTFRARGPSLSRVRARRLAWACVVGATAVAATSKAGEPAWSSWTASPRPVDAAILDPLERAALEACGTGEAGLRGTAQVLLAQKLRGLPLPDLDAIEAAQRAAGEPHPWPRAWAVSAKSLDREPAMARLATWLDTAKQGRSRRCGVASGTAGDGTKTLVVVTVDAFADLAPLPTQVRTGQWLTVEARLSSSATGGRVVVLGPTGATRSVPAWFDGRTLHARFAPDGPGQTTVQVVADLPGGPRPVLEAAVFADVEPSASVDDRVAPGEGTAPAARDDDRLAAMIAAARASAGLAPFVRDARLDAVAREHASRMASTHQLAHDVGEGDPVERLRAAGIEARDAGENVAHATSVSLAHRALWSSPSHRANLVGAFTRVGVAVARDEKGEAWVVEEMVR